MKVGHWLHTRFRINDLESSLHFYTRVLGMREVSRSTSPRGSTLVFLQPTVGGEMLELCHFPSSGPVQVPADLVHIALEVNDLDAFGRHAASLGYPWSDGPTITESGTRFAFLDAPEGYEVEIIERQRPSGKDSQ
ncbi:MAG: VOC family protein [Verrucomicrobia bacterium]|nr:VOC family protein [Verrucomicrobiota bacterium]